MVIRVFFEQGHWHFKIVILMNTFWRLGIFEKFYNDHLDVTPKRSGLGFFFYFFFKFYARLLNPWAHKSKKKCICCTYGLSILIKDIPTELTLTFLCQFYPIPAARSLIGLGGVVEWKWQSTLNYITKPYCAKVRQVCQLNCVYMNLNKKNIIVQSLNQR